MNVPDAGKHIRVRGAFEKRSRASRVAAHTIAADSIRASGCALRKHHSVMPSREGEAPAEPLAW